MTVKIIADSLGDVPSEVVKELGITIIPIHVIFGTESFQDGIDLTTEQFYDKLAHDKTYPTTSVPPLGTFTEAFDRLAEETDEIFVFTVSHKLSATYETASQSIELMKKKCRVEVIDTLGVAMSEGLQVISAAKAARDGASFDELIELTQRNKSRAEIRMVFDTLEYLKRGGRIGRAQALLGSVLRLHPVLGIKDGEIYPFGRERSRAKAIDCLYNFAKSFSSIEEIAVEDATTPDEADILAERLSSEFSKERIYRSKVSPVLGAHVGPHALSVSVLGDR